MGLSVYLTELKRDVVDVLANTGVGGAGTVNAGSARATTSNPTSLLCDAYLLLHSHCSDDVC